MDLNFSNQALLILMNFFAIASWVVILIAQKINSKNKFDKNT